MLMFRGVKLEDPSVSAFRRELLARWRDRDRRRGREGTTTTTTATSRTSPRATATPAPVATTAFRPLRPGDVIVKPPSLTTTMPTSTPTPLTIPREPEPVAAILDRRQTAVAKMAAWNRGDGPSASAAQNMNPGAAPVPAARAIRRSEPEPLADLFARRHATVRAARPWMEGN